MSQSLVQDHTTNIYDASDPKDWEQKYLRYKMNFWYKTGGVWYQSTWGEPMSYPEWRRAEIL